MPSSITQQKFYKIINNAIRNCSNSDNQPVNQEMNIFSEQYRYYRRANEQLDFSETIPTPEDVQAGSIFCDRLDKYRLSIDEYLSENPVLSEEEYRYIYQKLDEYQPHIEAENKATVGVLKQSLQKHLPEYRQMTLLQAYNARAEDIYQQKLHRGNRDYAVKKYENESIAFFEDVFNDKELKKINFCPEKLSLYHQTLLIVDCLPSDKVSRTNKYKLKISLNKAIKKTANALGPEYTDIARKAEKEVAKYEKAIEQAGYYGRKKMSDSFKIRNQKAKDEWFFK